MTGNEEFERRFNNFQQTSLEHHTRFNEEMDKLQQAITGLIQVARMHGEQIDRNNEQIKENSDQIKEIRESLKEQREHINTLIRIAEGHISNHP